MIMHTAITTQIAHQHRTELRRRADESRLIRRARPVLSGRNPRRIHPSRTAIHAALAPASP
jgi:hypothetical protein